MGGGGWARGASEKNWDPYLFLQPLKLATEKLVHNMSSGLPCQTQAIGRDVGSKLREYHSPPHYDDDATIFYVPSKTDGLVY